MKTSETISRNTSKCWNDLPKETTSAFTLKKYIHCLTHSLDNLNGLKSYAIVNKCPTFIITMSESSEVKVDIIQQIQFQSIGALQDYNVISSVLFTVATNAAHHFPLLKFAHDATHVG